MSIYKILFYTFSAGMLLFLFPYVLMSKEIFLYIAIACVIIALVVWQINRMQKTNS